MYLCCDTISSSPKVKKARLPGGGEFSCFISTNKLEDLVILLQLLLA